MEIFSEYGKKDHFLSKIDARIKLVVTLALLMMVLSYGGIAFPMLMMCTSFILCKGMKIPTRVFLRRLSEPFFIAFVLVMLKFMFTGKIAMFSLEIAGLRMIGHADGLVDGLMIAGRILGAVSVMAMLGFSTSFTEIAAGLSWFRMPKGFIEILIFAYRYVFVLLEDATVIYNAQKNRLGYSGIRRGLGSFGTLAGSLVIKAFDHSQNTTVAMVQRGYDGSTPMLRQRPLRSSEIFASLLFITVAGLVWRI